MDEKTKVSPGYVDSLWRFLVSLKLTVVVLLCLAALSIIGTVIPQNGPSQAYIQEYGPFSYQVFALLDIVDMYHSWWFVGLLLVLVVNIIACSIDRLQTTWKVIFDRAPRFELSQYRNRNNRIDVKVQPPASQLKALFERWLCRRFRYCKVVSTDKGFAVTAERGRWTRLGVYAVHLSIVVLLLGGLVGSKFGFDGFVKIPEGESADTITLNSSGRLFKLPFTIRCEDFTVQFYEGGQRPKEFRSSLIITENGREMLRKQIVVNDPLYYKGIGVYQSSYERLESTAKDVPEKLSADAPIELTFQSVESGIIYTRTATIGQPVQIPEGLGVLTLERFEPEAKFQSMSLGPALLGKLVSPEGEVQTITLPLRFAKFDAMRRGKVIIAAAAQNAAPAKERYATGLQVVYDPGVWVVYAGFILMILGCVVVFFMSHQQVVVEVTGEEKATRIMVAGKSNKNRVGFQFTLQRMAKHLAQLAEGDAKKA
ncbi:MAG: cytochrome c biogenesis protein ResB [Desulfobacteraceae bacterium]|nr:cytochrome c biogenesis protein ResB [Desulfobacteraceae bacterium]